MVCERWKRVPKRVSRFRGRGELLFESEATLKRTLNLNLDRLRTLSHQEATTVAGQAGSVTGVNCVGLYTELCEPDGDVKTSGGTKTNVSGSTRC